MVSDGYTVGNYGCFDPYSNDPKIVFQNVNKTVQSVLVSFSERNFHTDTSIQVYYAKKGEDFNESNSSAITKVPFGSLNTVIDIPKAEYESIRVDIDGMFI